MPVATYKVYKCPQCKAKTTLYQGDVITSLPICKNCQCMMELTDDAPNNIFDIIKNVFRK